MSQSGRRPGATVGNERVHILEMWWSRKYIQTLQGGPWVCAVLALVLTKGCLKKKENHQWLTRVAERKELDNVTHQPPPPTHSGPALLHNFPKLKKI